MISPVLIIHGGAGRKFKDTKRPVLLRKKILKILEMGFEKLAASNALEAVVHAVRFLENDPLFNAGTGSRLQADGKARLSASLMDGKNQKFSGVINIENVKNPILVAQLLLSEKDRVLEGRGAVAYAKEKGWKLADTRTKDAILQWKKWSEESFDTVGACALDSKGFLASATSTGGRGFERPGRVSDSGMPIANFADRICAISATGTGEEIIDEGLAVKIATRVCDGASLKSAFQTTFAEVRLRHRQMGAVGVDAYGNVAWDASTDTLLFGWKKNGQIETF